MGGSTPFDDLGPMPADRSMRTLDELIVQAPVRTMFQLAAQVERWPEYLPHYRFVKFLQRTPDGGGIVDMSANRPFGPLRWPTWWRSKMSVHSLAPSIRFLHIQGITTGMDVEWTFEEVAGGTHIRVLHVWNGPTWPLVGSTVATTVIGPVFVHGIASRTLAGLVRIAELQSREQGAPFHGGPGVRS